MATDGHIAVQPQKETETEGPSWQDMIIVYSTVREHVSIRDVEEGSWFIGTFTERLRKHAKTQHLEKILELVTEDMKGKKAMAGNEALFDVPVIEKRAFVKYFYFNV